MPVPLAAVACAVAASIFVACGSPEEEACDALPAPAPGTTYISKELLRGRWQHTATLFEVSGASEPLVGTSSEPVEVSWFIAEDRLTAVDAVGPRFEVAIVEHVQTPRYTSDLRPWCPPPERPWYDRDAAIIDWQLELVAAPDALGLDPSVMLESLAAGFSGLRAPSVVRSSDTGDAIAITFLSRYEATSCAECDDATLVVEHRFIRLPDPDR